MKIVKLEDFHADGGWDTYSFLKITTDEGLTGWSEFNESRRKGMTALIHGLGATLIGEDPCALGRIDAATRFAGVIASVEIFIGAAATTTAVPATPRGTAQAAQCVTPILLSLARARKFSGSILPDAADG